MQEFKQNFIDILQINHVSCNEIFTPEEVTITEQNAEKFLFFWVEGWEKPTLHNNILSRKNKLNVDDSLKFYIHQQWLMSIQNLYISVPLKPSFILLPKNK